jgi:Rrf2 family protein
MKLSTRGRYGARAMLDIALHNLEGKSKLHDIANRQEVSPKYLDHILASLRKADLIKNVRGRYGGYLLTRPAAQINLREVIQATEGSLAPVECVDKPEICSRNPICPATDVWKKLKEVIEETLESITIKDLVEMQKKKKPQPIDYQI